MKACTFVSELWRKKQLNMSILRFVQMSNTTSYAGNARLLHSGHRFIKSPLVNKANQEVTSQAYRLLNSVNNSSIQRCQFFSFASSRTNENETAQTENKRTSTMETNNENQTEPPDSKADLGATQSAKRRRRSVKRTKFSDSDSDSETDVSRDNLIKLLAKKEELLKKKQTEMDIMQDKALRSFAETDNVIERTKREAEISKKFAIQSFAKSLLDVADNLGRASSVVKEGFTKMDTTKDPSGALPLLKTLLEGVGMTEKQLAEVLKKFGVEKYDPTNEEFDPNRHNAVFQVTDPSKPANTVAVVMKAGYTLHERIIRPAEVGVTVGMVADDKETDTHQ